MVIQTLGLTPYDWQPAQRAPQSPTKRATAPTIRSSQLANGRLTTDFSGTDAMLHGMEFAVQLSSEETWRDHQLDTRTLDNITLARLTEIVCDLSPEVSKGVWDFLRLCNPGWSYTVKSPKGDDDTEDAAGKAIIEEFLATMKDRHGSVDVIINRIFLGGFLRGGFATELVFARDRQTAYELATPDPHSFRFRKVADPILKFRWQLGQFQSASQFTPLDFPTIKYVPIDPLPGRPEGRAPVSAALFGAIFLLGLLHDIRRVVAQQGWPRLDLEVQLEAIAAVLPDVVADDPEQFKNHVEDVINQVKAIYSQLEPDDTYIHTNVVKVNRPVGAVDASSLGGIDKLIITVERLTVRGLKSIPLLHGATEGVSEANANRQWETHAAGIKSIQHLVESMLESLLGLALQARGVQATVEWRFAELRAAEMLRDAQTEKMLIDNEVRKYNQGWTTQDEGALTITGHVADQDEPRNPIGAMAGFGGGIGNPATAQPDPGANRFTRNAQALALLLTTGLTEPASREIEAAEQWWRDNADDEAAGLIDAEVVE